MGEKLKLRWWLGAGLALLVACGGDALGGTPAPQGTDEAYDDKSGGSAAEGGKGETPPSNGSARGGASAPAPRGGSDSSAPKTDGGTSDPKGKPPVDEPLGTKTEFDSADTQGAALGAVQGRSGATAGTAGAAASTPTTTPPASMSPNAGAADSAGRASRTVERGDIYRVLGDQRILNLNSYRGVQILDIRDLSQPRIEGRLAVTGEPVELYVFNDRAIVLLNNWQGYYGTREDVKVESVQGGLVMTVDIRDRAHPTLIAQVPVAGSISTSRLTQDGTQAALYVASTSYTDRARTLVKSFDVSSGQIIAKSELDLGGYVQDVQASTDVLMVASADWEKNQGRSTVSVIDISRPDGTMVQGGSVLAQGLVQNKFNMDAYNGVLRVVSSASFNGALTNHLQTFSLSNLQRLTPIDDCTFGRRDPQSGQSEQLYATVFTGNRGFFVTYFRRDPFHAFSIDDQGRCAEHNEFIVSGWNDFLRPTLNDTRLIGIGHNDENNSLKLSVSLYDAVDLTNREPLFARADIDLAGAYSEASWDDRGFSVIEGAVSVAAADGTTETGLVLLPYGGWESSKQQQIARVQIFTFSDRTLTKRGSMDHGTQVRRSFQVQDKTTANLSQEVLSLFDTGNPDQPRELGRIDIAPSYSQVFVFGEHIARVRDNLTAYFYGGPMDQSREPAKSSVQVLSRTADVDGTSVLASFDVIAGANLTQVGSLLVSVYTTVTWNSTGTETVSLSKIQVFDLSDPTKPVARGSLETDRITPYYGGGFYPAGGRPVIDCFDCRYPYPGPATQNFVVGEAIAFLRGEQQQKSQGQVTQCYLYPASVNCSVDSMGNSSCDKFYSGGITCTTPQGGKETCSGQFYLCDAQGTCEPVDPPAVTNRQCSTYEQFRYWTSYSIDALDLRNPEAPTFAPRLSLPTDEEGTSVIGVGSTLYVNHQKPHGRANDPRAYVKRFVRLIDFKDPGQPAQGKAINVPGDIIAADGSTLYARDLVWQDQDARTLVSRLRLQDDLAYEQASMLFPDRSVSAVKLDGAGHVLVSSDPVYSSPGYPGGPIGRPTITPPPSAGMSPASAGTGMPPETPKSKLSILDAASLKTLGEADVDSWASFQDAQRGLALYQVSGGLLVFDVEDAAKPTAQAYFPTAGWPRQILFDGESILFAAGQYGVYRFDADVFNLLQK